MDHYKRMLLMEMEQSIAARADCLCRAFEWSFYESFYGVGASPRVSLVPDHHILEIFPEFQHLAREASTFTYLLQDGSIVSYSYEPFAEGYWWPPTQSSPRLTTIQTYLKGNI